MGSTIFSFLTRFFGSKQERDLKKLEPYLQLVNMVEPTLVELPDAELQARAAALREEITRSQAGDGYQVMPYLDRVAADVEAAGRHWAAAGEAGRAASVRWFAARLERQREAYTEGFKEDAVSAVLLGAFRPDRIEKSVTGYGNRLAAWADWDLSGDGFKDALCELLDGPVGARDPLLAYLPEAFALARVAAHRVVNLRHFDMQIVGGLVLHQGKIAEMKTGEGKTLVAVLPAFLNALTGKGVHMITVNEYLAKRDALWMGQIYSFLGLTVGTIQHRASLQLEPQDGVAPAAAYTPTDRRAVYRADITFGTNNEFGFDYLRDNMAPTIERCSQRGHYTYAIIDEVDSILVDEARTPLIISGPSEDNPERYVEAERISRALQQDKDFEIDEKEHSVNILDAGIKHIEGMLGIDNLYDSAQMKRVHDFRQALRARHLYQADVDYIVKEGQVIIVDQFTGRLMPGRRFSDGLHQAIEAKERVRVASENQTLATITLQNYFRMYDKLAGMTGTADTEAVEFKEIYDLDVVVVPTNLPTVRKDLDDAIYRSKREKIDAIVTEIKEIHRTGAPVLVGTISIEMSELLGRRLKKENIPHNILNAKYHEREADIVARAGQRGAVTIATNMAGRGTDIVLGPGVTELGGLHIIGTERHESRRIDNQLRGRAGRQGDPGETRFFVALEDDLMRLFGGDKVIWFMEKAGLEDGEVIIHPWISKSLERAQKRVEERNFDIRKNLIKFDDVMNGQREMIYRNRRQALEQDDIRDLVAGFIDNILADLGDYYCPPDKHPEDWDIDGLQQGLWNIFRHKWEALPPARDQQELLEALDDHFQELYREREEQLGVPQMRHLEKMVLLQIVDNQWKEHLLQMDHLREGIGLRAYGQRDPFVEYKNESARLFNRMVESIREEVVRFLFRIEVVSRPGVAGSERQLSLSHGPWRGFQAPGLPTPDQRGAANTRTRGTPLPGPRGAPPPKREPERRAIPKVGRNQPCPCGSGKKYKHCHGTT